MNFKELTVWVEAHPGESILIGGGGLIFILWLLGYFSPSASAPAQDPLAAAYYAAEAQQAVVAGQIQQTTLTTAAQTAQAGIQANAAVAINATQAGAATTINGQNASAATTINASNVGGAVTLGSLNSNNALLATYSNNDSLVAANASNNATAASINQSNNDAINYNAVITKLLPTELAWSQGAGAGFTLGNLGSFGGAEGPGPAGFAQAGFSPSQIQGIFSGMSQGGTYP
jgi:hypothetical protein